MSEYRVTFKKTYTVNQDDEALALDEATHNLGQDFASQTGLEDIFDTSVKKEPVKEILITEEGIKEFLQDHPLFDKEPTDEQIKKFMDFLDADVSEWLKENWKCFIKDD